MDEVAWAVANRERGALIDKNIDGTLTEEERARLDALQIYADDYLEKVASHPAYPPAIQRLMDEVRNEDVTLQGCFDRAHNRHNR